MTDRIPCEHCTGSGTVPLVPSLQEALDALRAAGGRAYPAQLTGALGCSGQAACMRFVKLLALGLVRRVSARNAKHAVYEVMP
jgi:hypothetical protein